MTPFQASAILGLESGDSSSDLRRKWRSLALQHHPDRGGDEEYFKLVANAFSVMANGGLAVWENNSYGYNEPMSSTPNFQLSGPVTYNYRRLPRRIDPWYYEEQEWLENEFGHLGYWSRLGLRR